MEGVLLCLCRTSPQRCNKTTLLGWLTGYIWLDGGNLDRVYNLLSLGTKTIFLAVEFFLNGPQILSH